MSLFYGRADTSKERETARGRTGGRYADPFDREMDETRDASLCRIHETRAAEVPGRVRPAFWRGLVARWAMRKCPYCRGVIPCGPAGRMDAAADAELETMLAATVRAARPATVRCKGWNAADTGHGTLILSIGTRDVSDTACGPCQAYMLGTMDAATGRGP